MTVSNQNRRVNVQGDGEWWRTPPHKVNTKPPGTISWEEHYEAWCIYDSVFHGGQSAERIAERGGFGYLELVRYLGHEPKTWEPRS